MFIGKNTMFNLAFRIGVVASKIRFCLPLLEYVQNKTVFLKVAYLAGKYRKDIEYAGANLFLIKKLQKIIELDSANTYMFDVILRSIDWLSKDKKGQINMSVGGCDFIIPFPYGVLEIYETFQTNSYDIPVKDAVILDIGGFIGDTAVFFAKKGARHISVYEPAPSLFNLALNNIVLNRVDDKVTLYNVAVGAEDGEATFKFNLFHPGGSSFATVENAIEYKVKLVSITRILNKPVDLLKMDVEGAEHEIVSAAEKADLLRNAKKIIMEIHGEPHKIIRTIKKNNFVVTTHQISPGLVILKAEQK
jgi:FkbM family methyltransferase